VVVNDLNVVRIVVTPPEAYSPLIIDADAELARAIPLELLKPIPAKHSKIFKAVSCVQY